MIISSFTDCLSPFFNCVIVFHFCFMLSPTILLSSGFPPKFWRFCSLSHKCLFPIVSPFFHSP